MFVPLKSLVKNDKIDWRSYREWKKNTVAESYLFCFGFVWSFFCLLGCFGWLGFFLLVGFWFFVCVCVFV